jgi:hypothetical protein
VAPNLEKIVIEDMKGCNSQRMDKFAAAEDVCFMTGIALEYQDVSSFARAGAPKLMECNVCPT